MRIAMVSEHASPASPLGGHDAGGQNVYVAALSAELARRGHEVTVYTRKDAPDLPRSVRFCPAPAPGLAASPRVTIEHVPAGPPGSVPKDQLLAYMPAFGDHLARAWTARTPDLVHAHFWMSGLASLLGSRGLDVPVVQTFHALGTVKRRHQGERDTSPAERIGVERWLGQQCSTVLATCTDEVLELTAMGVPPHRASVVPCGVDTDRFRPDGGTAGAPRRRHRHRLLATGRLVPRKGFDRAIRALAGLPDTELLIVGGPEPGLLDLEPEARRLRRLAGEVGVRERVRLLGSVPHERMPALLRSADVVLCTPVYEPFGIVPLEAMACGVPVVATGVGGHLDSVDDGVTGRLVPADCRSTALAHTVGELLRRRRLLRSCGRAGRRRALERFCWARVTDGVEEVYARAAARHRIPTEVVP